MKTPLFNYLRFTRSERFGTLVLFVIAAVALLLPQLLRQFPPQAPDTDFSAIKASLAAIKTLPGQPAEAPALFYFDPNTATREAFIRLGLSEKLAFTIEKYRSKGGVFREPAAFGKIWGLSEENFKRLLPYIRIGNEEVSADMLDKPDIQEKTAPEIFAFDPNSISEAELFRLGLPSATVKSILNYRIKGGKFRKPEDLKKMYAMSDSDYTRLIPLAQFPPEDVNANRPMQGKKTIDPAPVDINLAGIEQWKTLPGIGGKRAELVVQYREKLGGFQSVEQVAEMRSLPDSVFQQIRPWLRLGATQLRKINLNTASVADLDAHPYISKRQAELIVAYREQHGAYHAPEDITKMRAIADQAWLSKIKPYLGVE
jgi:competence ComEA-like helix-hairpin-helix protein